MALKVKEKLVHELIVPTARPKCSLIMPIASMGDYSESHWADVLSIVRSAVADAGLDASLVSFTDEASLIHKTIVQNLYDNPIVVCDVSGKNPNVMFELGLRLAFDKPTIIIKDDATDYSFDTGPIEHIPYPRDLRFNKIVDFSKKPTEKVTATVKASEDPSYSTFLKHFGKFTIAKLDEKEVSGQEFILEELQAIRQSIRSLNMRSLSPMKSFIAKKWLAIKTNDLDPQAVAELRKAISVVPGVISVESRPPLSSNLLHVQIQFSTYETTRKAILDIRDEMRVKKGLNPISVGAS